MSKRAKDSVEYGKGLPQAHCGICKHFERPRLCELVQGKIDPAHWCNLFSRRKSAKERSEGRYAHG